MIHGSTAPPAHPSGRATAALAAGIFGLLPLLPMMSGCEDAASAERNTVQRQINQAVHELTLVRLSGSLQPETYEDDRPQSRDTARTRLEDIARRTGAISQGTGGQREAAAMIAATAHFELGTLAAEDLDTFESVLMAQRGSLHIIADRALVLQGLVTGLNAAGFEAQRGLLTLSREEAETDRRNLEGEQRRLQSPIDERQLAIERDRAEANRFIEQAGGLRREALLVGASEGLPTWTQAIELERRAGRIDREIADREVELAYELRPEYEFTESLATARREQIRTIDEAMDAFGDARRSRQDVIASTEAVIRTFGEQMDAMLQRVSEASASADEQLEQVAEQFDRAAAEAQRAAQGAGRQSAGARMIALRAQKNIASQYVVRAAATESHAALLKRVADAGGTLGDAGRAARTGREAQERATMLKEKAKEYLEQARETAGMIPGNPDIDLIARRLDGALALLAGRTAPAEPAGRGAPARSGTPAAGGRAAAAVAGSDSPEALVAALQAVGSDPTGMDMMSLFHAEGLMGQRLLDLQRRVTTAMTQLVEAASEQFGGDPSELAGAMGGASMAATTLEDIVLVDQDENSARVTANNPMLGPLDLELVRTEQGWKLNYLSLFGELASDPQMLGMMEQQLRLMIPAMETVTRQIRSGEIDSPEGIEAALTSALMSGG